MKICMFLLNSSFEIDWRNQKMCKNINKSGKWGENLEMNQKMGEKYFKISLQYFLLKIDFFLQFVFSFQLYTHLHSFREHLLSNLTALIKTSSAHALLSPQHFDPLKRRKKQQVGVFKGLYSLF